MERVQEDFYFELKNEARPLRGPRLQAPIYGKSSAIGPELPITIPNLKGGLVAELQLFSHAEADFLRVLQTVVGQRALIMGKVRLWDVMRVRDGLAAGVRVSLQNRIKSRHVDYVLIAPDTFKILCAIELDDASHETLRGKKNDRIKNEIFQEADIPLVRIPGPRRRDSLYLSDLLHRIGI